jgi:hypothetical protein
MRLDRREDAGCRNSRVTHLANDAPALLEVSANAAHLCGSALDRLRGALEHADSLGSASELRGQRRARPGERARHGLRRREQLLPHLRAITAGPGQAATCTNMGKGGSGGE